MAEATSLQARRRRRRRSTASWAAPNGPAPRPTPSRSDRSGTERSGFYTPTQLYIAGVVTDVSPGLTPSFGVFFDNDHDGVKEPATTSGVRASASAPAARIVSMAGRGATAEPLQRFGPGRHERHGRRSEQLREQPDGVRGCHALLRGPRARRLHILGPDARDQPQYDRSTPGVFANSPGPDLFDPSNNWADLILAANDVTPPTVSVTAPTAGSVLRGTVSVTADASDNVGVTSVDFRYFGGSLPFVERHRHRGPVYRDVRHLVANTGVNAANIQPSPTTRPATRGQRATRSRSTTRRRAGSCSRAIAPETRRSTR